MAIWKVVNDRVASATRRKAKIVYQEGTNVRFYFRDDDRRRSSSNRDDGMKIPRGSYAPAGNPRFLYATVSHSWFLNKLESNRAYTKKIKIAILNILFLIKINTTTLDTILLFDFSSTLQSSLTEISIKD